jgi:hypothetical protein
MSGLPSHSAGAVAPDPPALVTHASSVPITPPQHLQHFPPDIHAPCSPLISPLTGHIPHNIIPPVQLAPTHMTRTDLPPHQQPHAPLPSYPSPHHHYHQHQHHYPPLPPPPPPPPLIEQLPEPEQLKTHANATQEDAEYTFSNLEEGVLRHMLFPLVLRRMTESVTGVSFDGPSPAAEKPSEVRQLEERALNLKAYAEQHGLEATCDSFASVDVFMAALVSALPSLVQRMVTGPDNRILQDTFKLAKAKFNKAVPTPPAVPISVKQHLQVADQTPSHLHSLPSKPKPEDFAAAGIRTQQQLYQQQLYNPRAHGLENTPAFGTPISSVEPEIDKQHSGRGHGLGHMLPRRKLNPHTRRILEAWFQANLHDPYPSETEKIRLANQCQVDVQQVCNCTPILLHVTASCVCEYPSQRIIQLFHGLTFELNRLASFLVIRYQTTTETSECG